MSAIVPITIYHTNDLHSDLTQWTSAVSYLKAQRRFHDKKKETSLFFDIGDHTDRSHVVTEATRGKGNVELLNEAEISHVTIGNNEGITFSRQELGNLYEKANFKVLLANLFDEQGKRPEWVLPYDVIETKEGIRLGLIGITIPFYPFYNELGWDIQDPLMLLPGILEEVKAQSDIIVLLSHMGLDYDEEIAESFPDIDVILGAHTHHLLKEAEIINQSLVAQCGKNAYYVGQVNLEFDTEKRELVSKKGYAVDVSHEPPSPETAGLLRRLETEAVAEMHEEIARIPSALPVSWTEPSPFADLLAEGLRDWCQTDLALINSGLLLESLAPGPVTKEDIHRLCPHPINPAVIEVSGAVLKESIHAAYTQKMIHLPLKGLGFRGIKLGVLAFSGITIEMGTAGEDALVKKIKIQGTDIENKKMYRVAAPDMFTFGPLYPGLSQTKQKKYFMPEMMRDVLQFILEKKYS
ncbi:2',3'-cyclic-nucleotide 2'-phosphodiesterase (5'-nucleotidase family) [Sinobaca qinghaiensis]|uniref:2',3'-cyclic-nucleotide 2'-phosphodiesterase (5'-nucleotidase family) n=1 Tax=Sinobaca qinghaiensis TaxID=342944 RepID=A0A419UW91_9BACL|nr:bifunctional UDP-sugar hydrolase/5'-nucleotidase [Sinobaca qinghaiensis]RKD68845.1 2',3'-cyclic-nucleotide 2'-phosphodiesterase (5'-nucleotidase family) [Sinobaca qinghaiensis]